MSDDTEITNAAESDYYDDRPCNEALTDNGPEVDVSNPEHLRFLWTRCAEIWDYLQPGNINNEDTRDLFEKLVAAYPVWKESHRAPINKPVEVKSFAEFTTMFGEFEPAKDFSDDAIAATLHRLTRPGAVPVLKRVSEDLDSAWVPADAAKSLMFTDDEGNDHPWPGGHDNEADEPAAIQWGGARGLQMGTVPVGVGASDDEPAPVDLDDTDS